MRACHGRRRRWRCSCRRRLRQGKALMRRRSPTFSVLSDANLGCRPARFCNKIQERYSGGHAATGCSRQNTERKCVYSTLFGGRNNYFTVSVVAFNTCFAFHGSKSCLQCACIRGHWLHFEFLAIQRVYSSVAVVQIILIRTIANLLPEDLVAPTATRPLFNRTDTI